MRKLLTLIFCFLSVVAVGHRTLDGETNKNWIKIVSSKIDRSGNAQDVCFLLDLSFYPGTAYDRLKTNPSTCLEECCWYSENKKVEFYFNDGFLKELEDTGASRRYYPDHITIKMTYSPFLNRLSAKATSTEGITKDGIVMLEYDDVYKTERMNDESFYRVEGKIFPEDLSLKKQKGPIYYKTFSMSGLNRDELLARAKAERDSYYKKAVAERYVSPEKEYVEESMLFNGQVSPFDKTDKETKWLSKKTLAEEELDRLNRYRQNRYTPEEKERKLKKKKGKIKNIEAEAEAEIDKDMTEVKESAADMKENLKKTGEDTKKAGENVVDKIDEEEKSLVAEGTATAEEAKSLAKETKSKVKENNKKVKEKAKDKAKDGKKKFDDMVMYDVQRPLAQEAKIVYIEPKMAENIDSDTLTKMLVYERTEAVKLLKRFYGDEIDAYLHALDKYKRLEGQILFTGDKIWQASKISTTTYKVDCNVKATVALLSNNSQTKTEDYPIYCGSYIVDLSERTVEARDDMARKIAQEEY